MSTRCWRPCGAGPPAERTITVMGGVRAAVAGVAILLLAACGGSDTSSKAAWTAEHGPALDVLDADLQAARTTLSSLQRPDILGTCGALRDSLAEARKGLPVPH